MDSTVSTTLALEAEQRRLNALRWSSAHSDTSLLKLIDENFTPTAGNGLLRITYVMSHVRICGGSKIIFEHTNQLIKRGHQVNIVCHFPKPDWIEVLANYIQVPFQMNIAQAIPETDIIVTTVSDQIIDCFLSKKAPVIHFEQGDVYIYEFEKCNPNDKEKFQAYFKLPVSMLAVSSGLSNKLKENFGRTAKVIHNALDSRYFFPRSENQINVSSVIPKILFVGSDQTKFKGIQDILVALEIVKAEGYSFEPIWVTQHQPMTKFDGTVYVSPSQSLLGDIYRSADIYVSGSYYESFPLPPLEAMSNGCAVITTRNAGVLEYANDRENCLLTDIGDPLGMANAIIELLKDQALKNNLVQSGYQTASKFHWNTIIKELETYFFGAIRQWKQSYKENKITLRVETLPNYLLKEEAIDCILHIQKTMDEDWCLWLVDGETIESLELNCLERMVNELNEDSYAIQVEYAQDIPDHVLVRTECRLLKKGCETFQTFNAGQRLPIRVKNAATDYFLPDWLSKVRYFYNNEKFSEAFTLLKHSFNNADVTERAIMLKWIILSLLELDETSQINQLLQDAIKEYPLYSDLFYLFGRINLELHKVFTSKKLLQSAFLIGDSYLYPEFIVNMEHLSKMYI